MAQIIQPNLAVVGKVGWCLKYAREVFSIPAFYLTAAKSWDGAKYKHTDTPPKDASVFVHFDWVGNSDDHIAVWHKGKVYSSPLSGSGHIEATSIQDLINIFKNHTVNGKPSPITLIYRGWSEDVNNVRVWKEDDMKFKDSGARRRILISEVLGRDRTQAHADKWTDEQTKIYGEKEYSEVAQIYWSSKEGANSRNTKDAWKDAYNELPSIKKTLADTQSALTDAQAVIAEQKTIMDELQAKVDAVDNGDVILITRTGWNGLFDAIKQYVDNFLKKG